MKRIYILLPLLLTVSFAFSQIEGTWNLAPQAAAMFVGPDLGSSEWWGNSADDVTTRACLFDDEFIFNSDGSFSNVQQGETWLETWQATDEGCAAPVAPHDGSNAATWSYDAGAGTFTLTGVGAHVGLPKVHNAGELSNPADAPASITYTVVFSNNDNTMDIDINFGGGWWHYVLARSGTSSVTDQNEKLFSFYPNPASTQIQISSDKQIDELVIRDITGKLMIVQTNLSSNTTVNVANLPKGLFLLEARSGDKISVQKLMLK